MSKAIHIAVFLIIFVTIFCLSASAQTTTEQPPRKEGDLWFEPYKTQIEGD